MTAIITLSSVMLMVYLARIPIIPPIWLTILNITRFSHTIDKKDHSL